MSVRADPANSLSYLLGVEGISPQEEDFKSPEHFRHALGINYHPIFNGGPHIEMAFNTGDGTKIYFHEFLRGSFLR